MKTTEEKNDKTSNSYRPTGKPEGIEFAFYKSAKRDAVRHVSGTTIREEALQDGRFNGLYWSAMGYIHRENVVETFPGLDPLVYPVNTFELEIDGQSLHNLWTWVGGAERKAKCPGTVETFVELKHNIRPVTIKVITRLDGTSIIARWLEITNTGKNPAALSHISPCCGVLWNTDAVLNPSADKSASKFSLGYLNGDDWGKEGNFEWYPLPPEQFRIERRKGRAHGSPYFVLKNNITGEIGFIGLGWSGNYFAEFTYTPDKVLSFKVGPYGTGPLRVISPGETICSPEVHIGMLHCDLDSASREWHKHMRASVIPPRPKGKEMFTVAGRVVEYPDEWILREIDIAKEMGVEAFMVDAGWYGEKFAAWWEQRGDWFEGNWLPGGMKGIREHAHKKGLLFGLWMEAESASENSKLRREHPDWILTTDNGKPVGQLAVNLTNPKAARYVEDSVRKCMSDFKVDFFKLDYNISTNEGGQNIRDGYAENHFWRHFEVLYGIFDRVLKDYPNVALENCAGGGGRNDLGILGRFHYACESDYSFFPYGLRAINAMSLFIPPESICYYHNHLTEANFTADLDTHLRVTLFALPIFVGFGAQNADRSTRYFAKVREYIELNKTFCRPIMANHPKVYHHTPDIGLTGPADWCVLEYAAQDKSRSYAGIFRLNDKGASEYLFYPRGLDVSKDYDVVLSNSGQKVRLSGWEFVNRGIRIKLDEALTSELLLFSMHN